MSAPTQNRHHRAILKTQPERPVPGGAARQRQSAITKPAPTRSSPAVAATRPAGAVVAATTNARAPRLDDPTLNLAAASLDDFERVRKAMASRIKILTATKPDKDGVLRGHGIPEDHPVVIANLILFDEALACEKKAQRTLKKAMQTHPLGPWVKAQCGVGDQQAARLLAAIGDPYWNARDDRPRTLYQLYAYCGLHTLPADQRYADPLNGHVGGAQPGSSDPGQCENAPRKEIAWVAARRRKGQKANWNVIARMRVWNISYSCIRQKNSPYRAHYLARREHTAITHPEWTDGHSHEDGLRIAGKAFMKDLWRASRELHGVTDTP